MSRKIKVVVHLTTGAEEVYEAEYPSSRLRCEEEAQGWKVIQEVCGPMKKPVFEDDGDNWYVISWSTVIYPVHAVKKIVYTTW